MKHASIPLQSLAASPSPQTLPAQAVPGKGCHQLSSGLILSDGRLSGRGSVLLSSAAPRSSEALSIWEGLTEDSRRCSPSPQHREGGEDADRLLDAPLPVVSPALCEGGEDAEIARWVWSLLHVCAAGAALREGLEQKRACLVHPHAERHFTHLLPETRGDFCCVRLPSEAVWTLKPTVAMLISHFICCHINSAFAFKRNRNAVA